MDWRPTADEMEREFPGVHAWYGLATHSWWALVRGADGTHLMVEAVTPRQLREEIINVRWWPWRHR